MATLGDGRLDVKVERLHLGHELQVLAASHDQTGTVAHLARVKYPALGEGSLSWASVRE